MEITFIVLGIVVVIVAVLFFIAKGRMKQLENVPESSKIITMDDKNFSHRVKTGIVLVDFWAAWCMPCKLMAPVLNELAEESNGKVTIGKVNIDEAKETAARFGIRSIPTMILFRNGKELHRIVGVKPIDYIRREIERRSIY